MSRDTTWKAGLVGLSVGLVGWLVSSTDLMVVGAMIMLVSIAADLILSIRAMIHRWRR